MKCVKNIFRDMHQIDAMNGGQAKEVLVDYCHTKLRFQEEKNILGPSLGVHIILNYTIRAWAR